MQAALQRTPMLRSLKALGKQPMLGLAAGSARGRRHLWSASRLVPSRVCSCSCASLSYRNPTSTTTSRLVPSQRRSFTASSSRLGPGTPEISELSDKEYREISDETMDTLTERLEAVSEQLGDADFDVEYSSGVLTVRLPNDKGIYVINKQPPNKQIWLSSPTSGPKRYDWSKEEQTWVYLRDGSKMLELLQEELTEKLGVELDFQ